jgi:hypothetical protein
MGGNACGSGSNAGLRGGSSGGGVYCVYICACHMPWACVVLCCVCVYGLMPWDLFSPHNSFAVPRSRCALRFGRDANMK